MVDNQPRGVWRALMYGFRSIVFKEMIHLRRDPTALVIALMIPVVQLSIIGFAIDFDVRHIPTIVVDDDRGPESRAYLQSLVNTHYIDIVARGERPEDAEDALRRGTASVAVIIPPDFGRRMAGGRTPSVRVLVDGSDSQVAIRARSAFSAAGSPVASQLVSPNAPAPPGTVDARVNILFNPSMRSQVFMIPGLIGVIMQLVIVSLTAFSLVREREQGTLEQLMVTPVGRLGLMLGKLVPYAGLAFLEMAAVLYLGWLVFDVSVAGSVAMLMLMAIPFIVATLSLGLLISTIAQNQGQALQFTMLITIPSILMSGFVFPRATMPGALYLLSDIIPVTYFLEILRGVVVRGAGFSDLWPDVAALVAISGVLLTIATTRFRKSAA